MSLSTPVLAQLHPMNANNENSVWNRLKYTLSNQNHFKAKQNSAKLSNTTTSYWNGVEMEIRGKTEYAYEDDKLVSTEHLLLEESSWGENSKTEYVYTNGLLSSVTYLRYVGEAYIPKQQYQYGFEILDGEPRLIAEIYREWEEGSGWMSKAKYEYQHVNGLISGGSESIWDISEWIEIERFTASFANDTTFINYFELESENWVENSREVYPSLTLKELYDLYTQISADIDLGLIYISLELPDYIYQEKVNGSWENVDGQLTIDYFDMFDGKLKMREIQHLHWDDEWMASFNNEIWYNQKADPDSATVYVFLVEEKEAAGQEIYTHNESSLLSQVDYLQNIGQGLALQSTTVLSWEVGTSNEPGTGVSSFELNPAYPNPFNPSTNISYSMARSGDIKISVYDVLGRHITTLVDGAQAAGEHRVQFDAGSLSSGLYIVRMVAADYQKTQMITLLK